MVNRPIDEPAEEEQNRDFGGGSREEEEHLSEDGEL